MISFQNIFLDFNDGRFSDILAEASAATSDLGVGSTCSAFSCLLEAKGIAAEIAKRESIAFPGGEKYESLLAELRERFLLAAGSYFKELWRKSDAKGIGKPEEISYKFSAIRVLELALSQNPGQELREELESNYLEYGKRLVAFDGTVKSAENTANSHWQNGNKASALEILRAGIVWHELAKISFGTDTLRRRLKQYTRDYSSALFEEASKTRNPDEAENLAIQALKAHMVGHAIDSNLLREVWLYVQRALEARFGQVKKRVTGLISAGQVNKAAEILKGSFWLLPANLEMAYQRFQSEMAKEGMEHFLLKSLAAKNLSAKIAHLDEALNILATFLPPENQAKVRAAGLKKLKRILASNLESAEKHMKSKCYPEVIACFKDAENNAGIFFSKRKEPFTSPDLSSLASLAERAEKAIARAEKQLESSKKAGVCPEGWKAVTKALEVYPHSPEAQDWKDTIESKLALSGETLDLHCAGGKYRWFARRSLTMARGGGNLPLSLWSISSPQQPIEFQWEQGEGTVTDHNARYGVYHRIDSGRGAGIEVNGTLYQRCAPQRPFSLKGEGELLVGMIGRIVWRVARAGLVLAFEKPYEPSQVDSKLKESLDDLWPLWREDTSLTIILAPNEITLGNGDSQTVPLPGGEDRGATVKRLKDRFLISATPGPVVAQGLEVTNTTLMKSISYAIGKSNISFRERH
jgi:hypothetical protein